MFANRTIYQLANDENLWKNAYKRSLPKIYEALSQVPYPEYWQYNLPSSRLFAYMILQENQKQVFDTPPTESILKWIDVVKSINTEQSTSVLLSNLFWPPEAKLTMDVMKQCFERKSIPLMTTGCYLLRRLTYTPADCPDEYGLEMTLNRNILGHYQAVEILLKVLENYDDPVLIAASICAINNVACDYNCERIVKGLGTKLIIDSMKKYPTKISVLDYGASALANILREIQDDNSVSLIVSNIDSILSLFYLPDVHPKNLISVLDLCFVITQQRSDFSSLYGPIVLPLIKDLLLKNVKLKNNNLLFVSCLTIHEFCNNSDNRKIALNLSLASLLLDFIDEVQETNILYSIFLALCFMLWENSDNHKAEFERFVSLAIDKIKQTENDTKLQLGLAVILGNYAAHDTAHWQYIKSFDVAPLLARAISKFAENPEYYEDLFTILDL